MMNRRNYLQASFVGATQLIMPSSSYARQFNIAADEDDAIARMIEAQLTNFVLVHKSKGQLTIIDNGNRGPTIRVILGTRKTPTPTGIFSLRDLANGPTYPKMLFHHDDRYAYLIHDVITGREAALLKQDPRSRELSAGCINIPQPSLGNVLRFARNKSKETMLVTPIAIMPERYSSQEFAKMVANFKPQIYGT